MIAPTTRHYITMSRVTTIISALAISRQVITITLITPTTLMNMLTIIIRMLNSHHTHMTMCTEPMIESDASSVVQLRSIIMSMITCAPVLPIIM